MNLLLWRRELYHWVVALVSWIFYCGNKCQISPFAQKLQWNAKGNIQTPLTKNRNVVPVSQTTFGSGDRKWCIKTHPKTQRSVFCIETNHCKLYTHSTGEFKVMLWVDIKGLIYPKIYVLTFHLQRTYQLCSGWICFYRQQIYFRYVHLFRNWFFLNYAVPLRLLCSDPCYPFDVILNNSKHSAPLCLRRLHGPLGPSVWWRQQPVPSLSWDWSTHDPETDPSDRGVLHWRVLSPNIHAAVI